MVPSQGERAKRLPDNRGPSAMRFVVSTLIAGAALALAQAAPAADRYWVGGSGSWSDTSHWATQRGGNGGASVPGAADDARFDASSGSGTVSFNVNATVRSLIVDAGASAALTFAFGSARVECTQDCIFGNGRFDQGNRGASTLVVGRNLDTANCGVSYASERSLSIHLTGTGFWRFSMSDPYQPLIWNLVAAQPGRTTTLRPVGEVRQGVDIDVENQLILSDQTAALVADHSEWSGPWPTTIEIHSAQATLDVVSSGTRIELGSLEHELIGSGPGQLQDSVQLDVNVYDITGGYRAAPGSGPTWRLTGPLQLGGAQLNIDKTARLATGGQTLSAASASVGGGSDGTGELDLSGAGRATFTGTVQLGAGTAKDGRIYLADGSLVAANLRVRAPTGFVTGTTGTLELTGAAPSGGTTYYVAANGNDANAGTSQGAPLRTAAAAFSRLRGGVSVLFRRGDVFDVASQAAVDADGGVIGAYGSGARPRLRLPNGAQLGLRGGDWMLYDAVIDFGEGSTAPPPGGAPAAPTLLP